MPFRTPTAGPLFGLGLVYSLLILWGSLFPFTGWQEVTDPLAFAGQWQLRRLSTPDIIVNGLVYIPLGVLLRLALRQWPAMPAIGTAIAFPALLSFLVEAAQAHLPARVPALSDFVLNTAGAVLGALLASLAMARPPRLPALRRYVFGRGPAADIALAALATWTLANLAPFVPSLDVGLVRHGLSPLAATVLDPARFDPSRALCAALGTFALVRVVRGGLRSGVAGARWLAYYVVGVCLLKAVIVTRQLTLEEMTGVLSALALSRIVPTEGPRGQALLIAIPMLAALTLEALRPETGGTRAFNWMPLLAHLGQPLLGLEVLLDTLWPYVLIGAAVSRLGWARRRSVLVAMAGCGGHAFLLEWIQQEIPGRTPDITPVLIALVTAWAVTWHARSAPPLSASAPG